jgi:hypothetical protein
VKQSNTVSNDEKYVIFKGFNHHFLKSILQLPRAIRCFYNFMRIYLGSGKEAMPERAAATATKPKEGTCVNVI